MAPAQIPYIQWVLQDLRAHLQAPTVSSKGRPVSLTTCVHRRPCPGLYPARTGSHWHHIDHVASTAFHCGCNCDHFGVLGPQVKRGPQGSGGAGRGAGGQVRTTARPSPAASGLLCPCRTLSPPLSPLPLPLLQLLRPPPHVPKPGGGPFVLFGNILLPCPHGPRYRSQPNINPAILLISMLPCLQATCGRLPQPSLTTQPVGTP